LLSINNQFIAASKSHLMKLVFGDMCVPQDIDKLLGCECVSVWGESFHCLNCLPGSGILECLSRTRQQNIPGGSEFTSHPWNSLKSPDILWSVAQKTIPSNLLFICSFICDHFLWISCVYCYHTSVALFWVKHLNNKFVRLSSHKGMLCPLKCCGPRFPFPVIRPWLLTLRPLTLRCGKQWPHTATPTVPANRPRPPERGHRVIKLKCGAVFCVFSVFLVDCRNPDAD